MPLIATRPISRVRLFDGRVHLYEEDEGGALVTERCLGKLSGDLFADLPPEHWGQLQEWLDQEADGERFRRDCMAAATYRH